MAAAGNGLYDEPAGEISAPGYLARETTIRWSVDGRSGIRLDLIAERAPFSLDFFRQLVRNGYEEPETLRPIRRWVRAPNFYIDTRNPRTERPLAASEVRVIEEAIGAAVPQLTGGRFSAGEIESAAAPFTARADYVEVVIVYEPEGDFCADARVGANPGRIRINYERCGSRCGAFAPETVAHEVGHAMGFWHTEAEGIMHPFTTISCDNLRFTEGEQFHARIAYSRPPGNMDVDRDPDTFLAVEAGRPPRIFCKH